MREIPSRNRYVGIYAIKASITKSAVNQKAMISSLEIGVVLPANSWLGALVDTHFGLAFSTDSVYRREYTSRYIV
jgi:hypothetical protein